MQAGTVKGSVKIFKIPRLMDRMTDRMMKLCGQSSTGRVGRMVLIWITAPAAPTGTAVAAGTPN